MRDVFRCIEGSLVLYKEPWVLLAFQKVSEYFQRGYRVFCGLGGSGRSQGRNRFLGVKWGLHPSNQASLAVMHA